MVNSVLTFVVVLILMLVINLRLGLILCAVLAGPDRGHRHVPAQVLPGLHRGEGAGQRGQRRPAGERGRPAGRPGLPARAGELRPVRRPVRRLPGVPAAGAADDRGLLPVRAGAVHDRRRGRPVRRGERGPQRRAHRRQPDRLPALGGLSCSPRCSRCRRCSTATSRPTSACSGSRACCRRRPARRQRRTRSGPAACAARSSCATCTSATRASGIEAIGGVSLSIAPGETVALVGPDRRRQVHAGQAHRPVL